MAEARIEALLDAWQAAWSDRDPAAFTSVCDPEVHFEDPVSSSPADGVEAVAALARQLWAAFPDARVETLGARLVDGRFAAAPAKLTGTHQAPIAGIPASGRPVTVPGIFYCELDGSRSRLLRVRVFFDRWAVAVQLGLLPSQGTLGEKALMMIRGFGLRAGR